MRDEPWFRLRPSKFMAGIRGLNANEVKVYFCLVCRIMEHSGPIEEDREILATYCEMRPTSFDTALDRLIRLKKLRRTDDGRLTNPYCEEEIAWRESKSQKSTLAGKKSAEKRLGKQALAPTDVEPTLNHKEREEEQESEGSSGGSARARDTRPLFDRVMEAVGINTADRWPEGWMPPTGEMHVNRWRDELGLSEDEIVLVAEGTRTRWKDPPKYPSALDRPMQRFAGDRHVETLVPLSPQPVNGGATRDRATARSVQTTNAFLAGARRLPGEAR